MNKPTLVVLLLALLLPWPLANPSQANAAADFLQASFDPATRMVAITGSLQAARGGEVMVAIADPHGKLEYLNQKQADTDGQFTFTYQSSNRTEGVYTARVLAVGAAGGAGGGAEPKAATFTMSSNSGNPPGGGGNGPIDGGTGPGNGPGTGVQPGDPGGPLQPQEGQEADRVALLSDGKAAILLPAAYDAVLRRLVVAMDDELVRQALAIARPDAAGIRTVVLHVAEEGVPEGAAGTAAYEWRLPASALYTAQSDARYEFRTPLGTVAVPSRLLATAPAANSQAGLVVGAVKRDRGGEQAPEAAAADGRSTIAIELELDGKLVQGFHLQAKVVVAVPYAPPAGGLAGDSAGIVTLRLDGVRARAVPSSSYDAVSGQVRFIARELGTFAVAYAPRTFDDLGGVAWARQAIEALAARDVVNGVATAQYSPGRAVTRAEFITMLMRALELDGWLADGNVVGAATGAGAEAEEGAGTEAVTGANGAATGGAFTDVAPESYAYPAIQAAKQLGIANGVGQGRFAPQASVTRQEMMVFVARAIRLLEPPNGPAGEPAGELPANGLPFADASGLAAYARASAALVIELGIVQGSGGLLRPGSELTRAQAAVALDNYLRSSMRGSEQ